MKKIVLFLLTMVYMTVSSGMAMEIHFCMGEKTGVNYFPSSGDACGRCGVKEKKGGCCTDEQKFIKLSGDHNAASSLHYSPLVFNLEAPAPIHYTALATTFFKIQIYKQTFADSGPPLYITNRVFRI